MREAYCRPALGVSFFRATESGRDVAGSRRPPATVASNIRSSTRCSECVAWGRGMTGAPRGVRDGTTAAGGQGLGEHRSVRITSVARREPGPSRLATTPVNVRLSLRSPGCRLGERLLRVRPDRTPAPTSPFYRAPSRTRAVAGTPSVWPQYGLEPPSDAALQPRREGVRHVSYDLAQCHEMTACSCLALDGSPDQAV